MEFEKKNTFTQQIFRQFYSINLRFLGEILRRNFRKNYAKFRNFHFTAKKKSSNQLFSNFFRRTLLSRNFCQKSEREFLLFPYCAHAHCGKIQNNAITAFIEKSTFFRQIIVFTKKKVDFTKYFELDRF